MTLISSSIKKKLTKKKKTTENEFHEREIIKGIIMPLLLSFE